MIPKLDHQIIDSLLKTDQYYMTMGQAVQRYSDVITTHRYINRRGVRFPQGFAEAVQEQIDAMGAINYRPAELDYFRTALPYLKETNIQWLERFRMNPALVSLSQVEQDFDLSYRGFAPDVVYFETPLLSIMSEVYSFMSGVKPDKNFLKRIAEKARRMKEAGVSFAEFGTRRAFSFDVHEQVLQVLMDYQAEPGKPGGLVGTSNLYLAKKYGLKPIGTYSHAWVMLHQGIFGTRMANKMAMNVWAEEFNAQLGTALTDTYTTEVFLRDFGPYLAKLFDGVRIDSGDPFEQADRIIAHLRSLPGGIDPATKKLTPSDGLDDDKAIALHRHVDGRMIDSYGIGGALTCDIQGYAPPDFVIKTDSVEIPRHGKIYVCKLSDTPGKASGHPLAISHAQYELGLTA